MCKSACRLNMTSEFDLEPIEKIKARKKYPDVVAGIICRKDCSNPDKDERETEDTSRKRVQVLLLSWYVVQEDPASTRC